MKQGNDFMLDILDWNAPAAQTDVLWRACFPTGARVVDGDVLLTVPFQAQRRTLRPEADADVPRRAYTLRVRAYGDSAVRLTVDFSRTADVPSASPADRPSVSDSPMLELHPSLVPEPLAVTPTATGWDVRDTSGALRLRVNTAVPPARPWGGTELSPPQETLDLTAYPDGVIAVPLMAYDHFFPEKIESLSLAFVTRDGEPHRALFAFHAAPQERFAGTGERFAKLDLAGRTLLLENTDALGVNNRRAYKNVPFYLSSRPYGLFMHTSAHIRLSLADVSTRAAQGLDEEPALDLFVIGGGTVERVLYNYRRLTGFPHDVPLWSYGTWMSRMSYFSADEVRGIARALRQGDFPCDVLHIDTGWFTTDWVCEWEFSPERFPDPPGFLREMREHGFRISLWQNPNLGTGNKLLPEAIAKRYLAPLKAGTADAGPGSDFSAPGAEEAPGVARQIDFSNPEAVAWYQGLLARLLRMGVAAIKTDFGEDVDLNGDFATIPAAKLHNLYALLYQRAAFEITEQVTGEGIIWARTSWAGCQRYPVHWGGDAACTWDGMAGSLRGGLHLGLSGFAFWSHDVPGFHGVPDFMGNWPSDDLYVRWTQFGAFTSHMRYHGTSPREPYEYPAVAGIVRKWLKLRYALIPYLVAQGRRATETGLPVLRALIFHHEDDPTCWHIDDEYYFGDDLLVAPVMNAEGVRDVYLPAGRWVDLWTGDVLEGARWLKAVRLPLERMPVYVRYGARIPVYPESVHSTQEMDLSKTVTLTFDDSYPGLSASILGRLTGL